MYLEKPKGGDFQLVPAGNHVAVCWRVCDLGTQATMYLGKQKLARKILVSWEIPDETVIVDGEAKPMVISNRYTFSMHEKAVLRKDLESWRGRTFTDDDFGPTGFNLRKLLGAGCMLNVIHQESAGKLYANIHNVSRLPKGMASPPAVNPHVYFSMQAPADYDAAVFNSFPAWLQDTIRKSPEHQAITGSLHGHDGPASSRDMDDEIPF